MSYMICHSWLIKVKNEILIKICFSSLTKSYCSKLMFAFYDNSASSSRECIYPFTNFGNSGKK